MPASRELAPTVHQVEVNPFLQQAEGVAFMKEIGVQPEAWAPFAEGRNNLLKNKVLACIGARYGKSAGQVILRWMLQRGFVVMAKSVRKDRMEENLGVFDLELTDEEMGHIATLETGASSFFSHRDPAIVKWMSQRRLDI